MRIVVVLVALLALGCSSKKPGRTVRIAAASNLTKAFEEVGKEFRAKTGITAELTFGSSGLLAKQIAQGAPYFVFAAANVRFAEAAVESGRCDPTSKWIYARGRIVVWTPSGTPAPRKLESLAEERFERIAIANPEHAPYGAAARQALKRLSLWPRVEDRIVLGDNVASTMVYARDRNADAAIVPLSLAVVTDGGEFLRIDPSLHDPIDQMLVVCGSGEEADAARKFVAFLDSPEGREVMTRYGFEIPGKPR